MASSAMRLSRILRRTLACWEYGFIVVGYFTDAGWVLILFVLGCDSGDES